MLKGDVRIAQGATSASGNDAVLWIDRADPFTGRPSKVIAYLEGGVRVEFEKADRAGPAGVPRGLSDRVWLGRFLTTAGIDLAAPVSAPPLGTTLTIGSTPGKLVRYFEGGFGVQFMLPLSPDRFHEGMTL